MGDPVEVRVESLGGQDLHWHHYSLEPRVDEETRTMITEIEVPNPNLELVPGMYATVVFKVERRPTRAGHTHRGRPPGYERYRVCRQQAGRDRGTASDTGPGDPDHL